MIRSTIRITAIAFLAQIFLMQVAVADGTWYVGASIGSTDFDNGIDGFQLGSDSTAMRFYGGYSFNEHFSVDGGTLTLVNLTPSSIPAGTRFGYRKTPTDFFSQPPAQYRCLTNSFCTAGLAHSSGMAKA